MKGEWYCQNCRLNPNDFDRKLNNQQFSVWFTSGTKSSLSGEQLALLPSGIEIIHRQNREDAQNDLLIALSKHTCNDCSVSS